MRSLRHPNCMKVFQLIDYKVRNQLFIISEFAQGGDLYHYMGEAVENGGLDESAVANMFRQCMEGVAFLHSRGFTHNDLKPDNILVMDAYQQGFAPQVVIADFGCGRHSTDDRPIFGDTRYQAPESVRAMKQYMEDPSIKCPRMGPSVDVWAMGVTLYELLSGGCIPFIYRRCALSNLGDVFEQLLDAVLSPDVVDVKGYCHEISPEAEHVVRSLLQKDAVVRTTAKQVLQESWFKIGKKMLPQHALSHIGFTATRNKLRQILLTALASRLRYGHVEKCHQMFRKFDPEASGMIARSSFVNAWTELGMDAAEAEEVFNRVDVDGDNALEFNEFVALTLDWDMLDDEVFEDHLQQLLGSIGASNENEIKITDLAQICQGAMEPAKLKDALEKVDTDGDGLLNIGELKTFLRGQNLQHTKTGYTLAARRQSHRNSQISGTTSLSAEPPEPPPHESHMASFIAMTPRKMEKLLRDVGN